MNRCATERGKKWNKTTLFRLCAGGVNKNLHSGSGLILAQQKWIFVEESRALI
jgi:hypothetical protein